MANGLVTGDDGVVRCWWGADPDDYRAYHDHEWGLPVADDTRLFEKICLEGFQAGLSWITILKKREHYRDAFAEFDPERVARFDRRKVARLLQDEGIVRNRAKIASAIRNAGVFLEIRSEFRTFNRFLWAFVGGRPRINRRRTHSSVPAHTAESEALSAELKRRGMNFVGPTVCYAYMQSIGMVNDHTVDCFRYPELGG
jgi:DNA-3-methyladenine glycosylase I